MKTILILFVFFLSFNLNAFEFLGFKGGMSYEEVVAKANSKSWYLKPFADDKNTYDIKNQQDITELTISFCQSKLFWLGFTWGTENFHIYPKLILSYEQQGFKIDDTSVRSYMSDNGMEHNSIDIAMRSNSHDYQIGVKLFSTDKYGVTNYQITYQYDYNYYCNN